MREQSLWAAIGKEGFEVFKKLTHVYDFRVLMAFLERMDDDNLFIASQTDVAKDLGITRQSVSTTFRRLHEQGILLKSQKSGITLFQLKPDLARKARLHIRRSGYDDEYKNFLDEWQEAIDQHRASPDYKPITVPKPDPNKPRPKRETPSKMKTAKTTGVIEGGQDTQESE